MTTAERLCFIACGSFFLLGLLTGAWKYLCIKKSRDAQAPAYVDIAHRASLLYAFACQLLAWFVRVGSLDERIELLACASLTLFFFLSVGTYLVHGVLGDTDNQLRRPHRLGTRELPSWLVEGFMLGVVCGEVGGFLVLFYGAI